MIETTFTTDDRQRAAASTRWPSPTASAATTSATTRRTSCCASSRASRASVELEMELAPRPEYGLVRPLFRARATTAGARSAARTRSPCAPACRSRSTTRRCAPRSPSREGERVGLRAALGAGRGDRARSRPPAERVAARIEDIVEGWRSWEAEHDIYDGPAPRARAASARACSRASPTGRPARSSPRRPPRCPRTVGGERNWDYRYSWIRDSSLTLEALYVGACSDEAEDFVSFMTSSAGGRVDERASLQIMYGIGGEHDLSERELPHLRGWRDSRPVRVGNGAWDQTQLDVYGELLDALYVYRERLGELHPEIQRFVADLADTAAAALARARRGHVGDARRAAAPPLLEGAVLGGARPRGEARARSSASTRQGRRVGRRARRDPRRRCSSAAGARSAAGLRAGLRLRRARRGRAADAARRLPARHRPAHALDDRGDRRAT